MNDVIVGDNEQRYCKPVCDVTVGIYPGFLPGMRQVRPDQARHITWHSQTCILGYNVLGENQS